MDHWWGASTLELPPIQLCHAGYIQPNTYMYSQIKELETSGKKYHAVSYYYALLLSSFIPTILIRPSIGTVCCMQQYVQADSLEE